MLKSFKRNELSSQSQLKTSVVRALRKRIEQVYPKLAGNMDDIFPKKMPAFEVKWSAIKATLYCISGEPLFYDIDGVIYPTLRVVHRFPEAFPRVQVDKGAIPFVLRGADVKCPGLTSAGGQIDESIPAQTPVVIYAEGKQHALAVGITVMSGADIKCINKDNAVKLIHMLNDGLWKELS